MVSELALGELVLANLQKAKDHGIKGERLLVFHAEDKT